MNKTKMMLTVTGGTMGLAVLVMAYFTWSAFSAKTVALEGDDDEGTAGLETVLSRAQMLSRKPIYPCAESLEAIESNRTVLADWRSEATKLCVRGDRLFEKTTPAAFKEFLVSDAKRLAALPGRANGVLVKPDFSFGPFKNYISGGMMPAESELATLQRKWDDVSTIIEILARSGIAELTGITEKERSEVNGQGAEVKGQRSKVKGNKQSKNRKIEKSKNPQKEPQTFSYVFSFTTKPSAFVKALNAFVLSERFITVEGFSMSRPRDVIVEALGGGKEKTATTSSSSSRRRRRGAAVEEKKADENKDAQGGLVTDPILDEPFAVTLTVNVRDFRSLEEDKKEEAKK